MYFNNTISEEELSLYEYIGEDFPLVNPYLNPSIEEKNNQENIKKMDDDKYEEAFEKEFDEVFIKGNKSNTLLNKEITPHIYKESPIKSKKKFIKKKILMNARNIENKKYFPFTPGIGIKKCIEKIGLIPTFLTSHWVLLSSSEKKGKNIKKTKFRIKDYSESTKGKLKRFEKKRKFKPDDIRKKIKARFHKVIKNIINIDLKKAGSKKLFDFFPQNFISNITIKLNHFALNYTYEELIQKDLVYEIMNQTQNERDLEKYKRNLEVLNYIDLNQEIFKVSLFNKIRKMKYKEILKAYFLSSEYEETIFDLHKKGESIEYIEDYINKSLNYLNFFSLYNPNMNGRYKSDFRMTLNDEESYDYE